MFNSIARENPAWLHATAFAAFMLISAPNVATTLAQGLDADGAIDTIVGSDVTTGEENSAADEGRIVAAIENTAANISEVRKKFSLDKVEIVFLSDLGDGQTPVEAKLEERKADVTELQKSIEGSAMFYHAVDSRQILLRDVVALEFDDNNGVTIFVAGSDPQQPSPE
ncbi:hypothetical protein [Mesorhizobium sp. CAU 1732]|uniref:hypothetical protein n=1 Tax=Mesorhizobium sp. CAU 1732 TaxID=3140358 RepID=UPI0032607F3F